MKIIFQTFAAIITAILLITVTSPVHASVVLAQIIDQNSPIRGITYVDGNLFQDETLAEETYSDRFTGFVLFGLDARPLDYFNVKYNVFAPGNTTLVATLALSGGPDWVLVHTMYYSTYPGAELIPWDSPTATLIADGNFYDVLSFATTEGDTYIFQYKNIMADVPEPKMLSTFFFGFFILISILHLRNDRRF
jgi:hypothetical protein